MRSFLRHGHRYELYSYGPVQGVPDGVVLRDAAEVLPPSDIILYPNGSPAIFANRFRYALQLRGAGLWVDTDVYCLRPMDFTGEHVFGWENEQFINNAVLCLPRDFPALEVLLQPFDGKVEPELAAPEVKARARSQQELAGRYDPASLGWGLTGPHALTHVLKAQGLDSLARPQAVFYPTGWQDAAWIADPGRRLEDVVAPDTVAVHLWNNCIRKIKDAPGRAGSFLQRLQREGA
jgi:hypothetical protein